ncbi:penicillin-binding transpeptidase domain-containing protein [Evansella tamaricis]|uniref:Penicillin-binding transpeptidase domain-containing protein n=1 Tax=Evansella tamaricis TaxID=2069301 RepID=A0ABS6JJZ4_9BACI|nr:penicillin-binding transpeptidase domain-containing protein [Evansella tamaricis]MBU9713715.1 penicillin-binding transpeptidase domain-containing protein [Evansella tamaricis]
MNRIRSMLFFAILTGLVIGCSDEEQVNPEDSLVSYVEAWEGQNYDAMIADLDEESQAELEGLDYVLQERMEKVHEDLGVQTIQVEFESRDFEEEEVDLDEVEELVYPVEVQMDSIAGDIQYSSEVVLVKEIKIDGDDEVEEWKVAWHPSHLFMGLETNEDKLDISSEYPNRGEIFDRNGKKLAVNGEVYNTGFVPDRTEDFDGATAAYAELLNLDVEEVRRLAGRYPDNPDWFADIQRIALNDLRRDQLLDIQGVLLDRVEGREYPFGDVSGHLIGYVGAITADELEERPGEGYNAHSIIGKRGLELELEERLRGERGVTISITDDEGNVKHVLKSSAPVDGENITLTIDVEMQRTLISTMGEDAGTAVVMNPTTGEVLALVSEPAFDSNLRYLGLRDPRAEGMDNTDVLFDRRFQNRYSPGSVFKPITAAMGIEEGTLDPEEVLSIDGKQWQPDSSWGSYEITRVNENVSDVNLETAMKFSDNIYFARQALNIGDSAMEEWAELFGFGESLPFGYPLYTSSIANDGLNSDILLADTGYGQGEVQMNPVHLATLYTMFVNEGSIVNPLLFTSEQPGMWKENVISSETAETVLNTLISVVEDSDGTAYRPEANHNRSMAGKTGTAELKESREVTDGEQLGWYVALDYENKDLLVAMMIENVEGRGGSGYTVNKVNEFLNRIGNW